VEQPTTTARAISSSLRPASAASNIWAALEFAGGSFALAQHRGEFIAFGLAQFDPITYIHSDLLVGEPDESTNESKIRRCAQPSTQGFTEKQGQYLAFIYTYSHMFRRPPAETDIAAPLSGQPALGPPDES